MIKWIKRFLDRLRHKANNSDNPTLANMGNLDEYEGNQAK